MPTFDRGHTYVNGEDATEDIFNDPWDALETFLNVTKLDGANLQDGIITPAMLTTALQQLIGVNGGRGKSIIAGEGTRTNVAYGALDGGAAPGPDRVTGVTLPTDGLLLISYEAMWKESVGTAGRAAIFLGANQLKIPMSDQASPVLQEAGLGPGGFGIEGTANTYRRLFTTGVGILTHTGNTAYTGDVTTGQILGQISSDGPSGVRASGFFNGTGLSLSFAEISGGYNSAHGGLVLVKAAAGSYDVSVQFKSSSGSITAKSRELRVEAVGF